MQTNERLIKTPYNSTYKKLAVQWLNQALYFVSSSVLADSFVLRNRQLLIAAKRWRALKMKKLLYILTIFLFGCNNNGQVENSSDKVQQDSTTQKLSTESDKQIIKAKKFEFKNPDRPVEDTLILKTINGDFLITPLGLFKTTTNDTIHLKTDLIVEKAYLYENETNYYIFFTETDHNAATSWIQKISKNPLKSESVEHIPGFNLGQPIIDEQFAYVTAIGFIGKIDLQTVKYVWKHKDLYDRGKHSFNSFDTVILNKNEIEFISGNYKSDNIDKVIVDNQTGEIKRIEK